RALRNANLAVLIALLARFALGRVSDEAPEFAFDFVQHGRFPGCSEERHHRGDVVTAARLEGGGDEPLASLGRRAGAREERPDRRGRQLSAQPIATDQELVALLEREPMRLDGRRLAVPADR